MNHEFTGTYVGISDDGYLLVRVGDHSYEIPVVALNFKPGDTIPIQGTIVASLPNSGLFKIVLSPMDTIQVDIDAIS